MKLFQKNELKTVWPFYLEHFLGYVLSIFHIFMIVYFISIGFSLTQVGLLMSAMALSMLIFEIPTGAVADIYGRKFSVLLGYFLEGLLLLSLIFSTNYYYILIVFTLLGFAATLSSGSKEAWIVDLIKHKKGRYIHDFFMKEHSIVGVAYIISGIVGALLVKQFGLAIIWPISGITFFISIGILLFADEHFIKRKVKVRQSIKELSKQTKTSVSYTKKHPVLFYLLLAGFFIMFAGVFSQGISWIPFLQELNFQEHWFGYMWSGMWAITAIAPLFSKKFLRRGKEISFFIKMSLIGAGLFLLVYFAKTWVFALGIMLIAEFFWEIQSPVSRTYFHEFVPKKLRATIGSVESMLFALAAIIAMPIVGYLVDIIGPRYVIMLSGILVAPAIIFYLKIKENK